MKRDSKESKSSNTDDGTTSSKSSKHRSSRASRCDCAPVKLKQLQTNMDGSISLVQRGTPQKHELSSSSESTGSSEHEKFVPKQMAQRYGSKKTLESKPESGLTSTQTVTESSEGSKELPSTKFVPKQMAQRYGTKKKQ